MRYYSDDEIAKAKEQDLLTYLLEREPEQLVYLSGGTYTTREHDSLKISNGKWMWWSQGIGGYTALDYLIKVRGLSFLEAVSVMLGESDSPPALSSKPKVVSSKRLLLPDKSETNDEIFRYLTARGIHPNLIRACIDNGLLYESLPYHNCIFLGFDEENTPRYASYRATKRDRIMGEAAGSDKRFAFRIDYDGTTLHVFEGAIDLLSFATLHKLWTGKWLKEPMLSLGGVSIPSDDPRRAKLPKALQAFLDNRPQIKRIRLHLDNDPAGSKSAHRIISLLRDSYDIQYVPPRDGKDVNEELLFLLQRLHEEERNDENGTKQ